MELPKAKCLKSTGWHEEEWPYLAANCPQSIYDNNFYMICIIITIVIETLLWIDNNCDQTLTSFEDETTSDTNCRE